MEAEFWSADERLCNRCQKDLGIEWVHWINESYES
jgi:hypothetical protein